MNISINSGTRKKKNAGHRNKRSLYHVVSGTLLILWAVIIFYPFYNALITSMVPLGVYVRQPFMLFPPAFDFSSYMFIFNWSYLITGFRTTAIVLVLGVAYNMFLTVTMAYVLSKKIPGRTMLNVFIVFTMFFQGGMIPGFLLIQSLGLIDSYFSMILPYGISIFNLMIMRTYFQGLPPEMAEAAYIDGASEVQILVRIYLPLSLPMIATIGLYYGVDRWNEWYSGMLYIRKLGMQPLQLLIRNMLESTNQISNMVPPSARPTAFAQGIQMAGVLISMLPVALIYPFLQRYFVKGLTLGGVKG